MHTYRVYVIEAVEPSGEKFLYVGQTALRLQQRLEQHAGGKKYCQRCTKRNYVVGIRGTKLRFRKDLMPREIFEERVLAENAERKLGRELRAKGYRVKGGH